MITARENTAKPIALVAGGASFIGSFLCEALLLQNCRVICIDKLISGRKENLKKCFASEDFVFFKEDLKKPLALKELAAFIFNLTSDERARQNLLELARQSKAKFLQVYKLGITGHQKISEDVDERVVWLADVYGPRMNLEKKDQLTLLFKAAVFGFPLKLAGQGQTKLYPTFVSDVIYGLTKAMFGAALGNKSVVLVNPQSISVLDLAHLLQDLSPRELKINFVSGEEKQRTIQGFETQEILGWQVKTKIKSGLKQTLKFFNQAGSRQKIMPEPVALPDEQRPAESLPENLPKKRTGLIKGVLVFLLILFLIFIFQFIDIFWGLMGLRNIQRALIKADFKKLTVAARQTKNAFGRAEKKWRHFSFKQKKLFSLAKTAGEGLESFGLAAAKADQLSNFILAQADGDFNEIIDEFNDHFDYGYRQLSLVEAELSVDKSVWQTIWGSQVKNKAKILADRLPEVREKALQFKEGVNLLPYLTGLDSKKTYLVLLQNNHELRPTGGFIGSFSLVTFDKGRLIDFEVKDVYSADGQLKGHVEPPEPLKKYLGEASWFLRDSNWDPDYVVSAQRAAWFLEKETGRVVDGVAAINLFTVQKLLAAVGEIKVPDFQEKITAANLFERAEYYSETGFFPGSTQKQDFLGTLSRALFEEIKQNHQQIQVELAKGLYQSLLAKDILLWVDNQPAMAVINKLDWSGVIKKVNCQLDGQLPCLQDYLMIVDANLGVNKANYFITRKTIWQTEFLEDGTIRKQLRIGYQNSSPADSFPGGSYKNYLRILVPLASQLEKVTFDGQEIELAKIDQGILHNKTYFGFLVNVPIKEVKAVEIIYWLSVKVNFNQANQYAMLWQKQPGIEDETIEIRVKAPNKISLLPYLPAFKTPATSTFVYLPVFNQDLNLELSLVGK